MIELSYLGNLLSGIAALVLAVIALRGYRLLYLDHELRIQQVAEGKARSGAALNVELHVETLPAHSDNEGGPYFTLQTRVEITNVGSEVWCLPAVYVSARALRPAPSAEPAAFYESDYAKLPACGLLSVPRNIAALPLSVFQLAPNERDTFVRWDVLNAQFLRLFPVLVVQVEAFGASAECLGFHADGSFGDCRIAWLEYSRSAKAHQYVVFGRATERSGEIEIGSRVLLDEHAAIEYAGTLKFKKLLASVSQWSRQLTVVLPSMDTLGAGAVEGESSRVNASTAIPR